MNLRKSLSRLNYEYLGLFATQAALERDQLKVSYDMVNGIGAITLLPLGGDGPAATLPALTAKRKSEGAWTGQKSDTTMLPKAEDPGTQEKVSEYLSRQNITDYPGEISKTIAYCEHNEGKEVCLWALEAKS